ncbi:unnamed protein product, partial [Meganyctiphanes norvegica]
MNSMLFTSLPGKMLGTSSRNISILKCIKPKSCSLHQGFILNKRATSWNLMHYKHLCIRADEPRHGPDQILPASSRKVWVANEPVQLLRSETGHNAQEPISVHTLLKRQSKAWATHRAMAVKREGKWKYWTFADYYEESRIVGKAFIKLGLDRFHGVAIMGANSPEWILSSLGCILAGGLSAGVYVTNSPEACRHLADDCKSQIVIVENEECLNKFLAVKDSLPHIKAIIQWTGHPGHSDVLTWDKLMDIGRAEDDTDLEERLTLQAVNQCATLVYTSGNTLIMRSILCYQGIKALHEICYENIFGQKPRGVLVSYLPFSHTAGYITDVFLGMSSAATLYFAPPDALRGGDLLGTFQEICFSGFLQVPPLSKRVYTYGSQTGECNSIAAKWTTYTAMMFSKPSPEQHQTLEFHDGYYCVEEAMDSGQVSHHLGFKQLERFIGRCCNLYDEVLTHIHSLEVLGIAVSEPKCVSPGRPYPRHDFFFSPGTGKLFPESEINFGHATEFDEDKAEVILRNRQHCRFDNKKPISGQALNHNSHNFTENDPLLDAKGLLRAKGRLHLVMKNAGLEIPLTFASEEIEHGYSLTPAHFLMG